MQIAKRLLQQTPTQVLNAKHNRSDGTQQKLGSV